MRVRTTRILGVVALGGALLSSTACIPGVGGGDKTAACKKMQQEIASIGVKAQGNLSNPTALAQTYTDAANNVRSEGKKAGGDVEEAANQVASDLDGLADTLRQAGQGNPSIPDGSKLTSSGVKLQQACNS
ncbi:hypothetical protein [Thermomonospora umbrina]|uniref:Small secreted protein n=1 Tax=Thermomonospora umbrina TaxID=111806 RepID=A0A3D9SWN7_9ACTN|nr:hypothetical protein [Thermomonospora umbrina]REE97415.1 hypothetical protein DFJ69_2885 [Thermomonospora umbrina]